jgi:hypothetical protein
VRFSHHDLGMIDPKQNFRRFALPRTQRGETAGTKEE